MDCHAGRVGGTGTTGIAVIAALPLYAAGNYASRIIVTGGIGVLAFEPTCLQNITAFVPLTYGRHALEQAVFYSASDQFGQDMAVLALTALVAVGLGTLAMRRGIAS